MSIKYVILLYKKLHMNLLSFTDKGIYCPVGKFYIDPWKPVNKALITHGHADHARWGMKSYLCHHFTVPILKSRIGAAIDVQGIAYNQPIHINGVTVSFHPSGHILGSAQIRLEYKGKIVVVSGDYKIQDDGLSTPFEPIKCHEFVTESTFGLPIYTHYSITKLNQAYEQAGVFLPAYHPLDFRESVAHTNGGIVIVPPSLVDTSLLKKIPHMVYAICSGWMQVRGARRWRSADAGFAISDHAYWNGLLTAVKETQAEKVYVTHGQTAVFAKYLNEIGIDAVELHTAFGNEEEETEQTPESL